MSKNSMSIPKVALTAKPVNLYVDGFNLYHAIDALNEPSLKWLNLRTLGLTYLRPGEVLNKIVFFTAVLTWDSSKQQRHRSYIKALEAVGVEVVESKFRKVKKHCRIMNRHCNRYEEKQTDVAIAVTMLADAMQDTFRRAILVTADSDQIPTVKKLRLLFPEKWITLAAPPNRGPEARELGGEVHERSPIEPGRLRSCLLPRDVYNVYGRKVATRPSSYEP